MTDKEHKVGEYIPMPNIWGGVDFDIKTKPPKREWINLTEEDYVLINQARLRPLAAAEYAVHLFKEKNK